MGRQTISDDTRSCSRVKVHLPVTLHEDPVHTFLTRSVNIGEGGILIEARGEHHLKKGHRITLEIGNLLGNDSGQRRTPVRVVRVEDDHIALEFI